MLFVWIASHIHVACRWTWLRECLESIGASSVLPDQVVLSISNDMGMSFAEINVMCGAALGSIPYTIYLHSARKHQFEHIKYIWENVVRHPYEPQWVLFCDDDDKYDVDRIREIKSVIKMGYSLAYYDLYVDFDGENDAMTHSEYHDFGNYCILMDLLNRFWTHPFYISNLDLIAKGVMDCAFMTWCDNYVQKIDKYLYYKRANMYILGSRCWGNQ
jgi:hypothetical protein